MMNIRLSSYIHTLRNSLVIQNKNKIKKIFNSNYKKKIKNTYYIFSKQLHT